LQTNMLAYHLDNIAAVAYFLHYVFRNMHVLCVWLYLLKGTLLTLQPNSILPAKHEPELCRCIDQAST
jgi:hypothetical protein